MRSFRDKGTFSISRISLTPFWVLATALAVVACVALGYWQLGRAREKQELADSFRRGGDTLVDVTTRPFHDLPRYQAVVLRGGYQPARQVLIDNMPGPAGQPGYRVLTPFRRDGDGLLLLVDRGWIPLGASRERLPDTTVADGAREIAGRLDRPPAPGLRAGHVQASADAGWPRVMNFPTSGDLSAALGEPVEPLIVLLHPEAPDGYDRNWQPAQRMGPERHLAYAIQWFALGLLAVALLVVAGLRRESPRSDST